MLQKFNTHFITIVFFFKKYVAEHVLYMLNFILCTCHRIFIIMIIYFI